MDLSQDQIKQAFKRQVDLCSGAGLAFMLQTVKDHFGVTDEPEAEPIPPKEPVGFMPDRRNPHLVRAIAWVLSEDRIPAASLPRKVRDQVDRVFKVLGKMCGRREGEPIPPHAAIRVALDNLLTDSLIMRVEGDR